MMKARNPLFVGGFPYTLITLGYIAVYTLMLFAEEGEDFSSGELIVLLISLVMLLVGSLYGLYWLISTARELRQKTKLSIPPAIVLFIPLANYWWMWQYGQAVEKYTRGKLQGTIAFLVIALLGPIGMAITQDYYNKLRIKTART